MNRITSISVAGLPIKLHFSNKNLGVYLDSKMSFDKQVSEICKASYIHICFLSHIRSSLTTEACRTIAAAKLDHDLTIVTFFLLAHLFPTWLVYSLFKIHSFELFPRNFAFVASHLFFLICIVSLSLHRIIFSYSYNHFQGVAVSTAILLRHTNFVPRYVPMRSLRFSFSLSMCLVP